MGLHGERSFGAVCWCAGEWGDRGAARKSWGRQGKGHLGDAGGVSPPCGVAVRGREAVGLLGEGALCPGNAGVAARWPSQNGQIQPKNSALVLGMGESWHCWALAARLWASPFDLLVLIPLQIPIPHQLASQCAAYEMEEIKLQNLRIGRAQRNI